MHWVMDKVLRGSWSWLSIIWNTILMIRPHLQLHKYTVGLIPFIHIKVTTNKEHVHTKRFA